MAHISIRRQDGGWHQITINGTDFSMEVYDGSLDLVEVGSEPGSPHNEIGLRLTLAIGQLDIDNDTDVPLTDHLAVAATRVRSLQDGE